MYDKVVYADAEVSVFFRDGQEVVLNMSETETGFIDFLFLQEEFSTSAENPVGVVSSNSMKVSIVSNDGSLVPSNKASQYYGKMDNTAYISAKLTELQCEVDSHITAVPVDIPLGKFFVDKWTSGNSYNDKNIATIEAVDLLTNIKKSAIPLVGAVKNESLSSYLLRLLNKINEDDRRDGIYDIACNPLGFGEFDEKCRMYNLDTTTMDALLNQISQGTLTNIYVGRDAKLTTDYLFDDNAATFVSTLDDDDNVTDLNAEDSTLKSYSGVNVLYNVGSIQKATEISSLSDQQVTAGTLELNNLGFNDSMYKVNAVSVTGSVANSVPNVSKFSYNNKVCDLEITSVTNQDCAVRMYGQTFSNTEKKTDISYVDKTGEVLTITNDVIEENKISIFQNHVLSLMQVKKDSFQAVGYFNPLIKLGDLVKLVSLDMGINDVYKVFGIELNIADSYESKLKLVKTLA